MKKHVLICVALGLLCLVQTNFAQQTAATQNQTQTQNEEEVSRYEVGGHYTALGGYDNGFGGRFTVNANRHLAIESEVNVFPLGRFRGNATQALIGIKAGKRWDRFGVFAKARPGFIYNSQGRAELNPSSTDINLNNRLRYKGATNFTADVGGVVEFYPTKKLITRFDFGDTITHFNSQDAFFIDSNGNLNTFRVPATTRHSFQFSAGIGFRF